MITARGHYDYDPAGHLRGHPDGLAGDLLLWAEAQRAGQGPPEASTDDMDATLAQLKQLGELRSQGVLSEAEFEQQKSRILGS
ncbi:MAG: SHOCT domain-containing protein [Pseudonocardiaceae bacterium]